MAFIGNTNTTQAFTPAIDYFSGNGSTTACTLSRPVASVAQVQAVVNNVAQNPSDAFTVSGSTITFTSAPSSGTNNIYVYYTSPITQVIAPGQNTVYPTSLSTTNALYWDTNANVGIGTTSPDSSNKLQVTGDIGLTWATDKFIGMKFGAGTSYKMGLVLKDSTRECKVWSQSSDSDDKITFYTGSTPSERMRIDSSGNLLVGTTSTFSPGGVPTTTSVSTGTAGNWALGIRHTSSASNPYGLAIQYPNSAPNAVSAQFIFCQDSAGTKFDVRSNGGIGNYSANNVNLSDQREKKNIKLAGNYLNKICQIPVKTFLFNDQTDDELNLGAIAQEVQAVAPELVSESNWGTVDEPKMRLSIYQTDLQYALMKSIQELKAINDTQAETINALTARLEALENK